MIIDLFPRAHARYTSLPLLGPLLGDLARWLRDKGFSLITIRHRIMRSRALEADLQRHDVQDLGELSRAKLLRFAPPKAKDNQHLSALVRSLAVYLEEQGVLRRPVISCAERLADAYREHLARVRGYAQRTADNHAAVARELLAFLRYDDDLSVLRTLGPLQLEAFKVFAYVCLHAERSSGRMVFERAELARSVGKSRSALGRCLRELVRKGVCTLEAAPNQHRRSHLQVRAAYWPYEPGTGSARRPAADAVRGQAAYVESVREMFRKPRCVRGPFGPGDERLAAAWHAAGVPLESVQRALLLGCVRKSMTLMDHPNQPLIASLAYFEGVLEEVREQSFPAGYWPHLEFNLGRCEQYWQTESDKAAGSARPNSGQAGRPAGVRRPPSHLRGDKEERRDDDGLSHQSTGL